MPDAPAADEPSSDGPDAPEIVTEVTPDDSSREVATWKFVAVIGAVLVVLAGGALAYHYRGKIFKSSSSSTAAPPAPIPRIEDNFDRADSTNIGSTSTGQPWHQAVGTWGITNKQAYVVTQNDKGPRNVVYVDTGAADGAVSAKAPKLVDGWGVVFRYQNPGGYWRVYWNAQFKAFHLVRFQNDKEVDAVPGGFLAPNAKDGMELRVEYVGSTITVFSNNVPLRTVSDTYLQNQTKVGLYIDKAGQPDARWTDFVATAGPNDPVRTAPSVTASTGTGPARTTGSGTASTGGAAGSADAGATTTTTG